METNKLPPTRTVIVEVNGEEYELEIEEPCEPDSEAPAIKS